MIGENQRSASPPLALTTDQVDPSALFSSIGITASIDGTGEANLFPYAALVPLTPGGELSPLLYSSPAAQQSSPTAALLPPFTNPHDFHSMHSTYFHPHMYQSPGEVVLNRGHYFNIQPHGENHGNVNIPYQPHHQSVPSNRVPQFNQYLQNVPLYPVMQPLYVRSPAPGINDHSYSYRPIEAINAAGSSGMQYQPDSNNGVRAHFKSPFYMSAQTPHYIGVDPVSRFILFRPPTHHPANSRYMPYNSPMVVKPSPILPNFDQQQRDSQLHSLFTRFQAIPTAQDIDTRKQVSKTRTEQIPLLVSLSDAFRQGHQGATHLQRSPLLEPVRELFPIEFRN